MLDADELDRIAHEENPNQQSRSAAPRCELQGRNISSAGLTMAVPEAGLAVSGAALSADRAQSGPTVSVYARSEGAVAPMLQIEDGSLPKPFGVTEDATALFRASREPLVQIGAGWTTTYNKCTNGSYSKWNAGWRSSAYTWRYNARDQRATGTEDAMGPAATVVSRGIDGCGLATGSPVASHIYQGRINSGLKPWNPIMKRAHWADVAFSTRKLFSTASKSSGSQFELRQMAVHEAGHVFGLGHAPNGSGQAMQGQGKYCMTALRTLGKGDLAAIKALYR